MKRNALALVLVLTALPSFADGRLHAMTASALRSAHAHCGEMHMQIGGTAPLLTAPAQEGAMTIAPTNGEKIHVETAPRRVLLAPALVQRTLGLEFSTVGPGGIGTCRPNEWSGMQTTMPAGTPGQVQGISFSHF